MSQIPKPAVKTKKRHIGSRYNPGRWRSVAILETLAQEIDKLVDKEKFQSVCNFVDQAIRLMLNELEETKPKEVPKPIPQQQPSIGIRPPQKPAPPQYPPQPTRRY